MALYQTGHVDDAIAHFQYALKLQPDLADTHNNLGAALVRKGEVEAAVVHYQRALQLKPDYAGAANNLAWVLATSPNDSTRNGARAVELAQRANQLSGGGNLVILRTLAAAYAEAGQFPKAVETARQAFELAGAEANKAFADVLQSEIRLYQAGTPLRDSVHTQ
jgi:Flp pilus assembly protein TadD